jgi:hypothetical protein
MVRHVREVVLGVALGIALTSSGCDGDGGGGSIPTNVPGDKRISDLTPAERDQLCMDVGQWLMSGPFLMDGCNAVAWLTTYLVGGADTAITEAELRQLCETSYADCVAGGVTSNCDATGLATCTATVSEYNMCLVDSTAALGVLPACSMLTRASLNNALTVLTSQPTTPACMSVSTKCPDAM